jgi:hypothetical protein
MFGYMGGSATIISGGTNPRSVPGRFLTCTVKQTIVLVTQIQPVSLAAR